MDSIAVASPRFYGHAEYASGPLWSVEGNLLAFSGKGGVFVHDPSTRLTSLVASGEVQQLVWLPGEKLVYNLQKRVNDFPGRGLMAELHLLNMKTGSDKKLMSTPAECLYMLQRTQSGRVAFSNRCSTSEWKVDIVDTTGSWTPVEEESISTLIWEQEGVPWIRKNGTTRRIVVEGPGQLWNTMPSTQGALFSVRCQAPDSVRTVIVTDHGKWFKVLPGFFHARQWSSDDRILLGMETTVDFDNTITASRLALFDLEAGTYSVISTPPGMIPVHPTWSEMTGNLAFADYATGSVVIGKLRKD